MDERMKQLLELPATDWDSLDDEDKRLSLDFGFALLALLSTEYLDTEKYARRIERLERKVSEIECTYDYVNKFGPSEERNACMAVPLEKWEEVIGFYLSLKSPDAETLSFLRQIAHKCEEGWPTTPTLLQAQWALSLIDSFGNWSQRQIKAEQVSLLQKIVRQWEKSATRVRLKRKTQGAE